MDRRLPLVCFTIRLLKLKNTNESLGKTLKNFSGRLEIFTEGRWGLVCDDFFDLKAANVACKQMGFERYDFQAT